MVKKLKKKLVITRGDKGAISIDKGSIFEVAAQKNLDIIDLTGAGDLFASGYLHGLINNMSQENCLKKGSEMSARVIQQIGARL